MNNCLFCQIINKELPSETIYEDNEIIAFNDKYPSAKTHILIVPKKHIATIKDLKEEESDEILIGKMIVIARNIAKEKNLEGYKLQFNVGEKGGQVIFHIHLHLMSD